MEKHFKQLIIARRDPGKLADFDVCTYGGRED